MINTKKILIIVPLLSFLISSCGPVYETHEEFIPPTTAAGLSCLQRIEVKRQSCSQQCRAKLQVCHHKAAQKAKQTLPLQYKDYAHKLELYNSELERYRLEERNQEREYSHMSEQYERYKDKCAKDSIYCSKKDEFKKKLRNLKYNKYSLTEPERPAEPTLASETQKHQNSCQSDCGCQQEYNRSYVSCGGRVVPHQICTRNCDK